MRARKVGRFRFRDSSHNFRRPRWIVEHDFIIGAYDLSEAALEAIVARYETYWSTRKLPKTAWSGLTHTSLRFEIEADDRADWDAFLEKLYTDPKNAVPCCPPLGASA